MTTTRANSTMPVLLGVALSLLVMLLVVGRASAADDCALCQRIAGQLAEAECGGKGGVGSCYYMHYKTHQQADCIDTKRCPGSGALTGKKDCTSTDCRLGAPPGGCGAGAELDAGAICDNDCWGRPCLTGSGTCLDVSAYAPLGIPSNCHSKCGCSE